MLLGLRVGDPDDELLGAWLAKESVRDIYLTDDPDEASLLIDKAIAGCAEDDVEEIRSLGRTLASWRTSILEHHNTGASKGPTEGLNLCVKKVKRSRLPNLRALSAEIAGPRRWRHVANATSSAPHPNGYSALARVEPEMIQTEKNQHPADFWKTSCRCHSRRIHWASSVPRRMSYAPVSTSHPTTPAGSQASFSTSTAARSWCVGE
jgi:hypothetical protein